MKRIEAINPIETTVAPETAASSLAGEQSSGTFVKLPGETEDLKQTFAAQVKQIRSLEYCFVNE